MTTAFSNFSYFVPIVDGSSSNAQKKQQSRRGSESRIHVFIAADRNGISGVSSRRKIVNPLVLRDPKLDDWFEDF